MENLVGKKMQLIVSAMELSKGKIYEVVEYDNDLGDEYIKVKINEDRISNWKEISKFREFTEEHENIKVGDIVEVLENSGTYMKKGNVHTVTDTSEYGYIQIDNEYTRFITRFKKYIEKEREELVKDISERLIKELNGDMSSRINDRKRHITRLRQDIGNYNKELSELYKRIREIMREIEVLENKTEESDKYINDLNAILDHEAVEKILPSSNGIVILTNRIDIFDKNGNKYRGGRYKLTIDFKKGTVYIYGRDEEYCRKSYWTDNDPHPHVDGDNGEACFGDAGSMISSAMGDEELYATFIIVYNFLQQTNIDDPAGKYVCNWDCIDENDNIIDNPLDNVYTECYDCGCELAEDEYYTCCDCEEHFCGDHVRYIDSISDYICNNCYDNNFERCNICNEILREGELYRCDECGNFVCEEHYQKSGDSIICEDCIDENYTWCEHCEDYVSNDDVFTCYQCGDTFCSDCDTNENVAEDGCSYCDECFRELQEEEEEEIEEDEE